jgi:CubicO group peptidase (beta-lactamase class C family)
MRSPKNGIFVQNPSRLTTRTDRLKTINTRMKRLFLRSHFCWLFLGLPTLCYSQHFIKTADSIRRIRTIPGMAYAVFSSDSILDWGVSGRRKLGSNDSIRLKDRWGIGTNTAAFTSYIAGYLVERGKIKWTTRLTEVFPELKKRIPLTYQGITLVALLSHQSNVPLYSQTSDWSKTPSLPGADTAARRKAFITYILTPGSPVDTMAGRKRKGFSVAGYVIATAMLEKISGKSWEKMIDEYINKPLGISIKFGWPNKIDTASPWGHGNIGGYFHAEGPDTWVGFNPILNPALSINISLHDYVKFMQENLRGLLGKKAHLNSQIFKQLHFGLLDNSLGWNNGSLENYSFSFHEGISLLFDCRAEIIEEKNIGILVLANSSDNGARAGVLNLARILEQYGLTR